MVEKGERISDESKVAKSLSNFFENAICSLGIKAKEYSQENYDLKNTVEIAIKKFEQHPSINLTNNEILTTKILLAMKIFISHQQIMRTF